MQPAIYILTNKKNGTLYIGVTSHLVQRIWQHRNDLVDGFSKKYQTHFLVFYELHHTMNDAISRGKQLKNWKRKWKLELIESFNPVWKDCWNDILC